MLIYMVHFKVKVAMMPLRRRVHAPLQFNLSSQERSNDDSQSVDHPSSVVMPSTSIQYSYSQAIICSDYGEVGVSRRLHHHCSGPELVERSFIDSLLSSPNSTHSLIMTRTW